MKASHSSAILLAAFLAMFGWMLWQQHPASKTSPAEPSVPVTLPPDDIKAPDLLATPEPPPVSLTQPVSLMPTPVLQPASFSLDEPVAKPYSPPPPPNPHAFPAWPERQPYRESQMQRGLFHTPMRLDK